MPEQRNLVPRGNRALEPDSQARMPFDAKQQRLMVGALCLLLLALGIVFWHDRDFWFPTAPQAESEPTEGAPAADVASLVQPKPVPQNAARSAKPKRRGHSQATIKPSGPTLNSDPASDAEAPAGAVITRTVLPPLEVEVIAGDTHRKLRPGSNSVHVDLQAEMPPLSAPEAAPVNRPERAAFVTDAAERVQMSADTADVVARPIKPSYPLLARQMKVQGSVILQALVGRDGVIQNLRVVSGPPILATAAQDAVRQWHFKPHLEGSEAVETQAKITVNFTISTN